MAIKLAFAGTGFNKTHAAAAQKAGADLVAVVNHQAESMAAFAKRFKIPRQYLQIEDLLKDGDFDALVIATPNYLHAPQTINALEAGYHVLVEKPMAVNAAEAAEMHHASQKAGKLLMVAHCLRFNPETIWLRKQVLAGRLGRIIRTSGSSVHVRGGPTGWFVQKKLAGGGAMLDMGVHALDTTQFLLGDPKPVSVYAKISTNFGSYDVDDTGIFIINWDTGVSSLFETGWWQPHADRPNTGIQLFGQTGYGSLFPTRIETCTDYAANPEVDCVVYSEIRPESTEDIMYANQMNYFIECIRENHTPIPGGTDGWTLMLIMDAAYQSSRTGRVVEL